MSTPYILGIDLGGTKIAAAAFDIDGNQLGKVARLPTMAKMKQVVTLMNLKRVAKQAAVDAGLEGPAQAVGMGSTGPLDIKNRVLLDEDSLPSLVGFPVGDFIENELGAPLHLENDAACFTLGEARQGTGRGEPVVVGITLGTGFGCGITINGQLYSGATSNAGEVAYCDVGESNYDTACSGGAVVRAYERMSGAEHNIDARQVGELASQGDEKAVSAWKLYGATVGQAIGTIAAVLDPSLVVLGGSVAKQLEFFRVELEAAARTKLARPVADRIRLESSQLGDAAGVIGAAELARTAILR